MSAVQDRFVSEQDQYIKVGRFNTRYWAKGDGSPVILIHGLGGFIETWVLNFQELAKHHRVIALDLPGHGKTEKLMNASYGLESLAQFVKQFMGELGVEKAHIAGHSLGGAVATRLALRHPGMVEKLILVSPAGFGREVGINLRIASLPMLGEPLTRPSLAGSKASAKMLVYDPALMTDEIIKLMYEMSAMPGAQKGFLKALRANVNFFGQKASMIAPNLEGMASIKCPVMLVWGREDQVVPAGHAAAPTQGFPNIRAHIFEHCGHTAMIEYPEHFNELLLEFLDH